MEVGFPLLLFYQMLHVPQSTFCLIHFQHNTFAYFFRPTQQTHYAVILFHPPLLLHTHTHTHMRSHSAVHLCRVCGTDGGVMEAVSALHVCLVQSRLTRSRTRASVATAASVRAPCARLHLRHCHTHTHTHTQALAKICDAVIKRAFTRHNLFTCRHP